MVPAPAHTNCLSAAVVEANGNNVIIADSFVAFYHWVATRGDTAGKLHENLHSRIVVLVMGNKWCTKWERRLCLGKFYGLVEVVGVVSKNDSWVTEENVKGGRSYIYRETSRVIGSIEGSKDSISIYIFRSRGSILFLIHSRVLRRLIKTLKTITLASNVFRNNYPRFGLFFVEWKLSPPSDTITTVNTVNISLTHYSIRDLVRRPPHTIKDTNCEVGDAVGAITSHSIKSVDDDDDDN